MERVAQILQGSALERAPKEHPDYRFFTQVPDGLWSVVEHPAEFAPGLPAVPEAYFSWPQRDTFSYATKPLFPEDVVARVDIQLKHEERDDDDAVGPQVGMRWRHVVLMKDGRELRNVWDVSRAGRPFKKPWPPSAAQALETHAREAVEVDDGRSDDEWLTLQAEEKREHWLSMRDDEKAARYLSESLERRRQAAWQLYRFLGAELYEALTASYRQPLAVALFKAKLPKDRTAELTERLKYIGGHLRAARKSLVLSVEQVAELTGLSKARVQGAERGTGTTKVTDLVVLAELYRLDTAELVEPERDDAQR